MTVCESWREWRMMSRSWILAFFVSEQPLDEAFDLLPAQQRQLPHLLTRRGNLNARQAERRPAFLMTHEPVPQPHDQRADSVRWRRRDSRKSAAHRPTTALST